MPQSKTQTSKLSKKSKPICKLYPDPSHKQGHAKTQNKTYQLNGEKKKKTRSCNFRL